MPIKGVIVAAGYGTRFLPVTRTIPKEMLPVIDRPALTRSQKLDRLAKAQPPSVTTHFIRQAVMRGTGDAILHARTFAGRDPVVVAFPDDLFGQPNCTAQLIETYKATGAAVLAAIDMQGQDVSSYGVIAPLEREDGHVGVRTVVEKPPVGTEPSHLVSVGRFLYTPELMDTLAALRDAHDFEAHPEYYPMPAMEAVAATGGLVAQAVDAPRWDTGQPLGLLKCAIEQGLQRPDMGPELRAWLTALLAR